MQAKDHFTLIIGYKLYLLLRGCRGRDGMIVGFITTYAIGAYPH
jgi:hypothetical protein